jgi:hypothetical protein
MFAHSNLPARSTGAALALRRSCPVFLRFRHGINEGMNLGLGGGFIMVLIYLLGVLLLTWRQ